jgi:eukaryotic-like serine/threonine-protein kinase
MTDLVGHTLLNRYYLREHIGSGGTADVYMAWDNIRSTKMAIKILRRDYVHNPHRFQMFAKEAEFLRQLEHPNIVRLYEFERDEDIAFIVMDWVAGTNLRQAIQQRKKPFDLEATSRILGPMCAALYFAHQKRIFHCDVKPANILLSDDGKVLLTDFGVARLTADEEGGGTPPYMAPEQFMKEEVDGRSDVYALGVTLYEMLTGGELPFRGDSPNSVGTTTKEKIGWEHLNQPVPTPRTITPDMPSAIETVVLTALCKEPEQRFQTPIQLRDAFEHARTVSPQHAGTLSTSSGSTATIRPQKDRQPEQKAVVSRVVTGPQLIGRKGNMAGQTIAIPTKGLTIGRSSDNQLQLTERSVSRRHVSILRMRRGVYVRDEGSSLGTILNGQRITGPTLLQNGDVIQIGYSEEFEYRER